MPKAFFEDVPIIGLTSLNWKTTSGINPVIQEIEIPKDGFERLINLGRSKVGFSLKIEDGNKVNEWRNILIIGMRPSDQPFTKRLMIADRRWLFKFKFIHKKYNVRRRAGSFRRGNWVEELQPQTVFKIQYHPQTTKDKLGREPWRAIDILKDVLINDDALNLNENEIIFDQELHTINNLPVENLLLNEQGDLALARALSFIPGAQFTVQANGRFRIFNSMSGRDKSVTGIGDPLNPGRAGHEMVGLGHIEFDDRRFQRPSDIDVYFAIESEFRMDFLGNKISDIGTITEDAPPRAVENVLPIPDFELTLPSGFSLGNAEGYAGLKVAQGTYLTIQQALDAWTQLLPQGRITNLDFDLISKMMIPGSAYMAALELLGANDLIGNKADWSARFASIKDNFLVTFRINRQWLDRFENIRDYLVATIDVTSWQRAPAMVFSDHALIPSHKFLWSNNQDLYFAQNILDCYPGRNTEITSRNRPAPAKLQILDNDQGILKIDYLLDPYLFTDTVLPAPVENMPASDFRKSNSNKPHGFNITSGNGKTPRLKLDPRIAILFSVSPAAPNSKRKYYKINIKPKDVQELFTPEAFEEISTKNFGPTKEIFIGPGVETARIRWKQSRKTDIEKIFGIGGEIKDPRKELKDLVINDKEQSAIGDLAASLPNIARAAAASIWAQQKGRVVGGMSSRMNSDLRLEGQIKELIHTLTEDGVARTAIGLPPELEPLDFFSFMDSNTRQIVLKQVQPIK